MGIELNGDAGLVQPFLRQVAELGREPDIRLANITSKAITIFISTIRMRSSQLEVESYWRRETRETLRYGIEQETAAESRTAPDIKIRRR